LDLYCILWLTLISNKGETEERGYYAIPLGLLTLCAKLGSFVISIETSILQPNTSTMFRHARHCRGPSLMAVYGPHTEKRIAEVIEAWTVRKPVHRRLEGVPGR